MELTRIAEELVSEIELLRFGLPVTHVYNPLEYAREPHLKYVQRYGSSPRDIVLIGMNPGPWGMAQTGVPFGEVNFVRNWLGIDGKVGKPPSEHFKRPVEGFSCSRSEVSGARLWGWAEEVFGKPEAFFSRFFVANYCPLLFIEESGRNRTPDKLPASEREPLFAACDLALRRTIQALEARMVIGVGAFAEKRVRLALNGMKLDIGRVLHPSPASPAANRGWGRQASAQLARYGIDVEQIACSIIET